jgi:hypothetical protein
VGEQYPAIIGMWRSAWSEFVPFLDYDVEIRRVICSTNAIESINARYRRAVKARGHFPTEQAALKCLYLVTRSLDPTGKGRARWAIRWKPALNAFAITFAGRIIPTTATSHHDRLHRSSDTPQQCAPHEFDLRIVLFSPPGNASRPFAPPPVHHCPRRRSWTVDSALTSAP